MLELANDLAERWGRARRAALRASLAGPTELATEEELLPVALARAPEELLKRVFDHSLKLGEGFRRFYKVDLPLAELVEVLPRLASPCLARTATRAAEEPAFLLECAPCFLATTHARACDYWREAISGLVHGMTGAVRHARHTSAGSGGTRCVDVLYVRPTSPLRFGPIPEEVRPGLASLAQTVRAFDSAILLEFLGISEGTLLYTTSRAGGTGQVGVTQVIQQGVRRRFPWLVARDASPQPIVLDPQP